MCDSSPHCRESSRNPISRSSSNEQNGDINSYPRLTNSSPLCEGGCTQCTTAAPSIAHNADVPRQPSRWSVIIGASTMSTLQAVGQAPPIRHPGLAAFGHLRSNTARQYIKGARGGPLGVFVLVIGSVFNHGANRVIIALSWRLLITRAAVSELKGRTQKSTILFCHPS